MDELIKTARKEAQGAALHICFQIYLDLYAQQITTEEKWQNFGGILKNLLKKYQDSQPKPIPDEG